MGALAHRLFWDTRHLTGTDDDAFLVPFDGSDNVCGWLRTVRLQVPEPVLFEANFEVTRQSDYPCNDVNWPIMSPRMLDVLRGVGDFPHRRIPVRLVNRRVRGQARYLSDGSFRPEVVDDRFAAVQLTEHLDVVDWEKSVFETSKLGAAVLYDFGKIVIREPAGGLPPLFRIPSQMSLLLVSSDARGALEDAGIRGIKFMSLPGSEDE
jgi:hypothetical protein